MKNMSLAMSIRLIVYLPFVLLFINFIYFQLTYGFNAFIVGLSVLALVCAIVSHLKIQRFLTLIDRVISVAKDAYLGKLESRITNIGKEDGLGLLAWYINEMLDQLETVFREVNTLLKNMSRGKYSRRAFPEGLNGSYSHILDDANDSVDITQKTMKNINQLMEALADGHFSKRIDLDVEGELKFRHWFTSMHEIKA